MFKSGHGSLTAGREEKRGAGISQQGLGSAETKRKDPYSLLILIVWFSI